MTLAKTFEGGMAGTSSGTMLSAGDPTAGSAGYVAIEAFTGTLDGRPGGFALQHSGTMNSGSQSLVIIVVPGSGTGALVGLSGRGNRDCGRGALLHAALSLAVRLVM